MASICTGLIVLFGRFVAYLSIAAAVVIAVICLGYAAIAASIRGVDWFQSTFPLRCPMFPTLLNRAPHDVASLTSPAAGSWLTTVLLGVIWMAGGLVTRFVIVGDTSQPTATPSCHISGTLAVDFDRGIASECRTGGGWVDLPPRESVAEADRELWPMLFQLDHRDEEPYRSARLRWVDAWERKHAGRSGSAVGKR